MSRYSTEMIVRFHDGDPGLISFYGNIYRFAHSAWEDFIRDALGFEYQQWFQNTEWGLPFRRSECDYLRPLFPGKKYRILVAIEEIRETSFVSRFEFLDPMQELCAVVRNVHTFVDAKSKKKIPVPSKIRERLEAHKL